MSAANETETPRGWFKAPPVEGESVQEIKENALGPAIGRIRRVRAARSSAEAAKLETSDVPFLPWNMQIEEPKTGVLDFARFPFQKQLYEDALAYAKEMAIMKATQLGISSYLIRWVIFFADTKRLTAMYVFPKQKQLESFSHQRIRPLIARNQYLKSRVPYGYISNVSLKQIGTGFVNFRGSQNPDELDSVDADLLAFDEYDRLVQANIPIAEARISGSLEGMIRRVGVPSIPKFGISAFYERSDKRRWMVECEACGEWQDIDFFQNVDQDLIAIVCRHCRKRLDVAKGEWVAEFLDGDRPPGFHINRLLPATANLPEIIAHSKLRKPYEVQRFWNRDLGLGFAASDAQLTETVIKAAQRDYEMVQGYAGPHPTTMGIDMASTRSCSIRISELISEHEKRALWIGEIDDPDLRSFIRKLGDLMVRYRIHMASIDHLPDGRVARELARMFPGRVYVTALSGTIQKAILSVDDDDMTATAKRVEAIDGMITQVRAQQNLLPGFDGGGLPEHYTEQMCALVRFEEEDEETGKRVVEYRSTGPDDYGLAETFDMIAVELFYRRVGLHVVAGPEEQQFDELVPEYRRSSVNELDDMTWMPGPTEGGFGPDESGFGPGDDNF